MYKSNTWPHQINGVQIFVLIEYLLFNGIRLHYGGKYFRMNAIGHVTVALA